MTPIDDKALKSPLDDTDVLARTLYGEAERGDLEDAEAIASVVLNRVRHRQWPDNVADVCLQPWQFSCWNKGNPQLPAIKNAGLDDPWFVACWRIAKKAVAGEMADITDGATHYFATYIATPKWAEGKVPCFQTPWGRYNHLFFNDIDTPKPRAVTATKVAGGTAAVTGGTAAVAESGILSRVAEVAGTADPVLRVLSRLGDLWPWLAGGVLFAVVVAVGLAWWLDRRDGGRT
jgi:N-acetylmuramoyl-L-alanine amidase